MRHFKLCLDHFEKACAVVVERLGTDWIRFYRHLPFHPARGNATIDADIQVRVDSMSIAFLISEMWPLHDVRNKTTLELTMYSDVTVVPGHAPVKLLSRLIQKCLKTTLLFHEKSGRKWRAATVRGLRHFRTAFRNGGRVHRFQKTSSLFLLLLLPYRAYCIHAW